MFIRHFVHPHQMSIEALLLSCTLSSIFLISVCLQKEPVPLNIT